MIVMIHFPFWRHLACFMAWFGLMATVSMAEPAAMDKPPIPAQGIQGLWVWSSEEFATSKAQEELLGFSKANGINRLLVQIHFVKDAQPPRLRYPQEIADLVAKAAEMGIGVEALDGAPLMASAINQPRTLAELDAILDWNRSLPEKARLRGMHYDIEPYISAEWRTGQAQRNLIMRDLLEFYRQARRRLDDQQLGLLLATDIPMFYDRKTDPDDHCILEFNGQTKNLYQHLIDMCDYVGIMSYRRNALGRNSVVEHVENELNYAQSVGKTVCPALETIQLKQDANITFFGTSIGEFWTQHNRVRQTLQDRPGFGGMLTHSYRGLRDLTTPPK